MALSTYSELQAGVADFLNRQDLAATIPSFIALAEARLARDLRHWRMETRATAAFEGRYTALPDDWLETRRLTMGNVSEGYPALLLASINELEQMRADGRDVPGVPQFYAHVDGGIEVFPTPSEPMLNAELLYIARVPALSDAAPTNWLLAAAPDAYLYGALMHTAGYLAADERLPTWAGLYAEAVAALDATSKRARTSGTSMRLRPPR